jgi:Domain of unknown function (DUF4411)
MLYLLDANVLITANNTYYPIDSVPEYWDWISHQAAAGALKMPLEIYEEIKEGGPDDLLFAWASKNDVKAVLILQEQVNEAHVAKCTSIG